MSENDDTRKDFRIAGVGVFLACMGAFCLYAYELLKPADMESWGLTLSYVAFIVGGLLLALRYRMGCERSIFFIVVTLGISLVLSNISADPMNDVLFASKFTISVLGIVLIVLAVMYMLGFRYNIARMTRILLILVGLNVMPIFLDWFMGYAVIDTVTYYLPTILLIACYAATLWLMSTDGIKVINQTKQLSSNIDRFCDVAYNDGEEYITPDDLDILLDEERRGWTVVDEGPVSNEVVLKLWHGVEYTMFTARVWRADGRMTLEFDGGCSDHVSNHMTFCVRQAIMSESGHNVTFYDDRGTFITLIVDDVRLGDSAVTNAYRVISKSELNEYKDP